MPRRLGWSSCRFFERGEPGRMSGSVRPRVLKRKSLPLGLSWCIFFFHKGCKRYVETQLLVKGGVKMNPTEQH